MSSVYRAKGRSSGKSGPAPLPRGIGTPEAHEQGQRPSGVFHRQLPPNRQTENPQTPQSKMEHPPQED